MSMKKERKKKKKRHGSHGMITVFVTLLMVPVVAVSGILVDVARLKLYSSQAVMAADSYGNAVLSEFDNLLKELYGLFSVTQNAEGLAAVEELAEYASYSFKPDGDGKELDGFMPYKEADTELSWEKVEGASLSNNNVLMTQISDFMKYRIAEEVLEENGILDALGQFDYLGEDTAAMEKRKDITDDCTDALETIEEYYRELEKLAAYPAYLEEREDAFLSYSEELTDISESGEYEDYVDYLENGDEDEEEDEDEGEDWDEYVEDLEETLSELSEEANDHDSEPIDFENTGETIDKLGEKARELEHILEDLEKRIAELEEILDGCSEDVKTGIREEIKELKGILELGDDFKETWELIAEKNGCKAKNEENEAFFDENVPDLDEVMEDILNGDLEPGESTWPDETSVSWYDFRDDKRSFYEELQRFCGAGSEKGEKDKGDQEIDRADEERKKQEDSLEGDEETDARDISASLAKEIGIGETSGGEVPELGDYFAGGLSFEALSKAGSNVLDKFLVTSYDFGMFSSRVSGIAPEEGREESQETYVDESLTGIPMSRNVNYLYGAELEYLFGGHKKSVSNLNETRNIICGVRLALNFASTYSIDEINTAIKVIADAAAAASTAAAPLVRVAVSGALRLTVSTIETVQDWSGLKDREKITLYKTELSQLESLDLLIDFLGAGNLDQKEAGTKKNGIELSYEDYLYVLLCLLVDDNTLLSRTSDLITLNVNQAKSGGDTLSDLSFKMEDTVTAVKATCKVKADFLVLPDYIAEWYYSGTDAGAWIDVLEDHYFGYSILRGY